jgi:uncharacterized lipoprotein YddW (UPF0748 family)
MKKLTVLMLALILSISAFSTGATAADNDKARHKVLKNLLKENDMKARILWYDLAANMERLNSQEAVEAMVEKTHKANIDTIILDVKNYTGFVGYNSEIAPHVSESKMPKYKDFPAGFDMLEAILTEAKERGIKVHAAVNVFSEGNNDHKDGPAFNHPEWQTVFYQATRTAETDTGSTFPIFAMNTSRGSNQLILYTPDKYEVSPANQYGAEVQVVDGTVTKVVDRVYGAPAVDVPDNGYVLSGHGEARTWILNNVKTGQKMDVDGQKTELVPASQYPTFSTFVNAINPEVQEYELSIIRELINNYDIDGMVLDRARYSSIYADFSDLSRQKFEAFIGKKVENWPTNIYTVSFAKGTKEVVPGPLYKQWIEFRAGNIQSFFKRAENVVHTLKPDMLFSTYVGGWYPLYYSEGVNWASRTNQPDYDWASDNYGSTGYAETLDFLMTGNYYTEITPEEALAKGNPEWYSVEGSADLAFDVVNEATFVYGSLYLIQYAHDREEFRRALRSTLAHSHGIMLFDLVYLEMYNWWDILEEEFAEDSTAPHDIPGLLKMVRDDK